MSPRIARRTLLAALVAVCAVNVTHSTVEHRGGYSARSAGGGTLYTHEARPVSEGLVHPATESPGAP